MRKIRLSIAQKLVISLGMLILLSFVILVSAHLGKLYDTNLRESELLARTESMAYSHRFANNLDETIAVLETLRSIMDQMREDQAQNRDYIVRVLQKVLEEHPNVLGVYTLWEPNAFDGKDALHRSKLSYDDETGRFIPYAVRTGDAIEVLPLQNYEDEVEGAYYQIPKRTKRFSLIEPYMYEVEGKQIPMTSLVLPILDGQGEYLGMVGADISLEVVQAQVEKIHPLGGYANIVTSGNRYLANGLNPELVMKPYVAWPGEDGDMLPRSAKPELRYTSDVELSGQVFRLFYPIPIMDEMWHFETVIPKDNMLTDFHKSLVDSISITVGALFLMSFIILYLVRVIILENIRKVIQVTSAVAAGSMDHKLDIQSNDEFEYMADQFNKMIDHRIETERLIEYQATHDLLTGLPNRNAYHRYIENIMASGMPRPEGHFVLLFIDLDRFKVINDTLDYGSGDKLLKQIADRIVKAIGARGKVFRFGGDEFIALLENVNHLHRTLMLAEDVLTAIAEQIVINERMFYITASIGIGIKSEMKPDTGDQLVKEADIAMYVAKKERNTSKMYSPSMNDVPKKELMLENSLYKALEHGQFTLFYQPKIEMTTGRIYGAEALIRWKHPEFGMVSPLDFIPIAEKTGFIIPLGEWVLHTACQQIREWERMGMTGMSVSVNMSMLQFQQKHIVHTIERIISDAGIRPQQIELEITESIFMDNAVHTLKVLHELQNLGVKLSLDDFGTGYSSLSYLQNIPLHTLKLDKSFISDIVSDFKKQMIFKSLIVIAHNLNLKVVTEGVETQEELSIIREHKCDAVQGYIYSPPVPAARFAEIYLEHNR
ncbi:EAL domain-containing protein [Paenibacillus harenae]|uniref:EAL domain-containing protein n=1 Tax=Paenibacillus harenae TaxID=306543 RepID=UPI00278E571C|nr:EAL domain-containing protein [Paenibacillus harenae]MDQ0063584.1 diguanylate cyclase (GGDEF)-like protein [Paenibacillus harenae]